MTSVEDIPASKMENREDDRESSISDDDMSIILAEPSLVMETQSVEDPMTQSKYAQVSTDLIDPRMLSIL